MVVLGCSGCIEDRLAVDIATRVNPDGSCSRRIEYRLERIDGDKRVSIPAAESPLRILHRFPRGEGWSLREDMEGEVHTVVVEGSLTSPNELEGDYWRRTAPRSHPAQNHVSFALVKGESYEYAETILDPVSPLATGRLVAQVFLKRDDEFAERLHVALEDPQLRRGDLKRIFRDTFALPFSRDVAFLAARPIYGPRERRAAEDLLERATKRSEAMTEALQQRLPGRDRAALAEAIDGALEAGTAEFEKEFEAAGLPFPEREAKLRFRATLTLPVPIVRANTCAAGDTATWEFEGEDLYGRGFEMWARGVSR